MFLVSPHPTPVGELIGLCEVKYQTEHLLKYNLVGISASMRDPKSMFGTLYRDWSHIIFPQ